MTAELLAALVAQGNRAAARSLLHHCQSTLSVAQRQALDELVERTRVASGQVLAPVLLADGSALGGRGIAARVTLVADGPHSSSVRDLEGLETLLDRAWQAVSASGARPRVGVRLELLDLLGLERIEGSSLELAILLAAVAHFAGELPPSNVIATGSFVAELRDLDAKLDLLARVRAELELDRVLVASSHPLQIDPKVVHCAALSDALNRAFALPPWHATAPIDFVHVYCNEQNREPIGRARGRILHSVELPFPLRPEHQSDAESRCLEAITAAGERVELTAAVPSAFAARLGYLLRNRPQRIKFIDGRTQQPAWHNWAFVPRATRAPSRDERRVALLTGGEVPAGWQRFDLGEDVATSPQALRSVLERFLAEYGGGPRLHLAVGGPLSLAWALGSVLRNIQPFSIYQFVPKTRRYEPWFDGP